MDLRIFEFLIRLFSLLLLISVIRASVILFIYIPITRDRDNASHVTREEDSLIISVWFNGNGLLAGATCGYPWPLVSLTHGNFPESNGQRFPRPCRARSWNVAVVYALVRRWIDRPETLWSWSFIARQFGCTWLRTIVKLRKHAQEVNVFFVWSFAKSGATLATIIKSFFEEHVTDEKGFAFWDLFWSLLKFERRKFEFQRNFKDIKLQ